MIREYLMRRCIFYAFATVFYSVPFFYLWFYEAEPLTPVNKLLIALAGLASASFFLCIFCIKLLINKKVC